MNIVLRCLVIVTLILNGVALWFATSLHAKRELLIDRNVVLEDFIVKIAKTFEKEDLPHENTAANHEERDVSPVSLETADITPDKGDFWEDYKEEMETIPEESYSIDARKDDLQEIYLLNADGTARLDRTGKPTKAGAPMAKLLEEVNQKAMDQRRRINNVRSELKKVRVELEDTIAELNSTKKSARESLKTIAQKDEQIGTLESEKARIEEEKSALESEKSALEDEKASLQADLEASEEKLQIANDQVTQLKATIEKIVQQGGGQKSDAAVASANLTAGVKGSVVRADNDYNFCIVKVDDQTMKELVGEDGERELPEIELLVRHKGAANAQVIAKIRVRTITRENNALICDILEDWKQDTIKTGDEVFYLD